MKTSKPIGTIVLIDDNSIDQRLCERLILRSGLVDEFIGFLSAEDALDYLRKQSLPAVDAILLDVNMPRMDGFQFLEIATTELGDKFARIVVMMLTTSLNPRDQERAKRYSVVKDYCNKPLAMDYLLRVEELLTTKSDEQS